MKAKILLMVFSLLLSLNACASDYVRIEVYVYEGDGVPVEGADVTGLFFTDQVLNKENSPNHRSITDSEGSAEVSGRDPRNVEVYASKAGYYVSKNKLNVRKIDHGKINILLRPKRNPIALYAKHVKGYIPKNKTKIGFDFTEGDWVSPYGSGFNNDIYFYHDGYSKSFTDFGGELSISFRNVSDGLIDLEYEAGIYSELKLPYEAPESGYRSKKVLIHKRKGKGSDTVKENNLSRKNNFGYFLRINSKLDNSGNLIQANYVKIGGEFNFDPRTEGKGAAYFEMTYYYNPTPNDRNLEFDPKRNLFKNLKPEERVSQP